MKVVLIFSCILLIIILYCCQNFDETFMNVNTKKDRIEQQQLLRDYYFYDYKNIDFKTIQDNDGDMINNRYNSNVRSNVNTRYKDNQYFKLTPLYDSTSEKKIFDINPDAIKQPPKTYNYLFKHNNCQPGQNIENNIKIIDDDDQEKLTNNTKHLFPNNETKEYESVLNGKYFGKDQKILPYDQTNVTESIIC